MAGDKVTVGRVEIVSLSDSNLEFSPTDFYPAVPAGAWESNKNFLTSGGSLRFNVGSYVLRSDGRTILVDTGIGAGPVEAFGGAMGQLMKEFQDKGITVDDIDTVALTHLHPDHVGWNLTQVDGKYQPTFPKARYLIPQRDWDYFRQPDVLEQYSYYQRHGASAGRPGQHRICTRGEHYHIGN